MTLSRRDTLRLATALAATPIVPFAASPEQAAALLAQPATIDPYLDRESERDDLNDPVSFAASLNGVDVGASAAGAAAEQWATYKQALSAVVAAAPEAFTAAVLANPLGVLDDAVSDLATLAWMGGIRAGAAYEHLRLVLATPREVCRCNGHGRLHNGTGGGYGCSDELCPECGGCGTVARLGAVLSTAAE